MPIHNTTRGTARRPIDDAATSCDARLLLPSAFLRLSMPYKHPSRVIYVLAQTERMLFWMALIGLNQKKYGAALLPRH